MSNKIYYKGQEYSGGEIKPVKAEKNQVLAGDGEEWIKGSPFYSYQEIKKVGDNSIITLYNSSSLSKFIVIDKDTEEELDLIAELIRVSEELYEAEYDKAVTELTTSIKTTIRNTTLQNMADNTNYYYSDKLYYYPVGSTRSRNTYWYYYPNGTYDMYKSDVKVITKEPSISGITEISMTVSYGFYGHTTKSKNTTYDFDDEEKRPSPGVSYNFTYNEQKYSLNLGDKTINSISTFDIKDFTDSSNWQVDIQLATSDEQENFYALLGDLQYKNINNEIIFTNEDQGIVTRLGPHLNSSYINNDIGYYPNPEEDFSVSGLNITNNSEIQAIKHSTLVARNAATAVIENSAHLHIAGTKNGYEKSYGEDTRLTMFNGAKFTMDTKNSEILVHGGALHMSTNEGVGTPFVGVKGNVSVDISNRGDCEGYPSIYGGAVARGENDPWNNEYGSHTGAALVLHDHGQIIVEENAVIKAARNGDLFVNGNCRLEIGHYETDSYNIKDFVGDFASGYVSFAEDDSHRQPALLMKGGSAIIMNAKPSSEISSSVTDYDPLMLINPNEFIFVGQGSRGASTAKVASYGEWNSPKISFCGPNEMNDNSRNPQVRIADNTMVLIESGEEGTGHTYIKVGSNDNGRITALIGGDDTFIQTSGQAHFEMHDTSYFTIDTDKRGFAVMRLSSLANPSGPSTPPLYSPPLVMRHASNLIPYYGGALETTSYQNSNYYLSLFATIEDDTQSFTIAGGSYWNNITLTSLVDKTIKGNEWRVKGDFITENNITYLTFNSQKVCTVALTNNQLTFGPLLNSNLKQYRGAFLQWVDQNSWYTGFGFSLKETNIVPIVQIEIGNVWTTVAKGSDNNLSVNFSVPVNLNEDEFSTPAQNLYFIGIDTIAGNVAERDYTNRNVYTNSYQVEDSDLVLGTNSLLTTAERDDNYGYLALGKNNGIKLWGSKTADKISIKCGSQKILMRGSNITIGSNACGLIVKDGASLNLSGSGSITFENSGTLYMTNGGSARIHSGGSLEIQQGASINMTDGTRIQMKEGSSINLSANDGGIQLNGGASCLQLDYMQIIGDYTTEEVTIHNDDTDEDEIKEIKRGQITIKTLCNGDLPEGELSDAVTFTFAELKALKQLLSGE